MLASLPLIGSCTKSGTAGGGNEEEAGAASCRWVVQRGEELGDYGLTAPCLNLTWQPQEVPGVGTLIAGLRWEGFAPLPQGASWSQAAQG